MPYSARYDNGKTGTQKIDITVNYTLDNYVTISGIVNGEYVKKSGYLQKGGTDSLHEQRVVLAGDKRRRFFVAKFADELEYSGKVTWSFNNARCR